ncbi:MAG TPA: hypothetical protein VGH84_02690 [Steroidobacteraceae bacterium]|jgi:hypothetical protein
MAGSATLYTEQSVLGHTLGFAAMPEPAGAWIGLCDAATAPTSTTGGVELVGNGYARQAAAFALLTTPPNIAANSATVAFPPATASWGSIGWFEVWDAASAGNRLYWGPLVDPADGVTPVTRAVLSGDIVRFTAGVIEVQAT